MGGMEIDKDGTVKPDGRLFFGGDYILNDNSVFTLVIQGTENGKPIEKINLVAKTERSARMETNKISPMIKYNKPRFITIEKLKEAENKRDLVAGTNSNGF